jgi:hypothetical protein
MRGVRLLSQKRYNSFCQVLCNHYHSGKNEQMITNILVGGFIIIIIIGIVYNEIHRKKYDELMSYLQDNFPGIYQDIRVKPVFGIFYRNPGAYSPTIKFAREHKSLKDPVAEKLLADYARISELSVKLIGGILLLFGLGVVGFAIFILVSR